MTTPGTAPVKPEFLVPVSSILPPVPDDDAAEGASRPNQAEQDKDNENDPRTSRNKLTKERKRALRGANKGRRFAKIRDELDLCWRIASGKICEFGAECRYSHDIATYLAAKPQDLRIPTGTAAIQPFTTPNSEANPKYPSIRQGTICPVFEEMGECKYGFKCRFLGGHVRFNDTGEPELTTNDAKKARFAVAAAELNFITPETWKLLRTRKYDCPISAQYLRELRATGDQDTNNQLAPKEIADQNMDVSSQNQTPLTNGAGTTVDRTIAKRTGDEVPQTDTPDVPTRFSEKKRLHWSGKTYLAPLTTVGNLPFRRLCVSLGADITCGEMGLATSFLSGSKEEWSLVRRHPCETTFGVQIAGNKPSTLVPVAEVIAKECGNNVDFVDVNCGCPIDLVFRTGSGSALLDTPGRLGRILVGMNMALGEIPVTVKLRTGVMEGRNTAHKLMPRLSGEWGAGCISIHGRTRQQRYTKLADWGYMKHCVGVVRAYEADHDLPRVPIFGGGDCYSSEGYWSAVEESGVDGVMVGRGALIKPWIFTEIKEHREWDISSRERLELVRKYAEFGINHFGSDTAGINTTRRYLCEALSFQYRYIPIGLLERLPGRINERAPAFRGRDELETLLASSDCRDWVKISEMFLGPAPESWTFTPKHKSNTYGSEESQG